MKFRDVKLGTYLIHAASREKAMVINLRPELGLIDVLWTDKGEEEERKSPSEFDRDKSIDVNKDGN